MNSNDAPGGFVKLRRNLLEDPIWTQHPHAWFRVYVAILLKVNWKPGRWWNGSREVIVQPGSMITSVDKLKELTGITQKQVRNALEYLASAGIIQDCGASRFRTITLSNWDSCEDSKNPKGKGEFFQGRKRAMSEGNQKGKQDSATNHSSGEAYDFQTETEGKVDGNVKGQEKGRLRATIEEGKNKEAEYSTQPSASLSSLNSVLTSTASGLHDDEPQKARSDVRLTVAAAKANSKSKTGKAETSAKTAAGSHEKASHEKERLLAVWTNAELAAVRQAVTEYMEGDFEPPAGFEQSCELRARGATAAEVCELLERKYAVKRYHLYHKYGPGGIEGDASMWNWFLTVIGNDFDHPHIPEPTAARASTELSRGKFEEMTSALEGGEELS